MWGGRADYYVAAGAGWKLQSLLDLLTPGRRMGDGKCQQALPLSDWSQLTDSVWEWQLSAPWVVLTLRGEKRGSRPSTRLGWSLSSPFAPNEVVEGSRASSVPASHGLFSLLDVMCVWRFSFWALMTPGSGVREH